MSGPDLTPDYEGIDGEPTPDPIVYASPLSAPLAAMFTAADAAAEACLAGNHRFVPMVIGDGYGCAECGAEPVQTPYVEAGPDVYLESFLDACFATFGAEFHALTADQQIAVAADLCEACEDDGIGAGEYRARIGARNLASYAASLAAQQ